jgi:predicted peptidase
MARYGKFIVAGLLLAGGLLLTGCATSAQFTEPGLHPAAMEGAFTRSFALDYWLYLPEGYTPDGEAWPLIFFLHGAGERGTDPNDVLRIGIAKRAKEKGDLPFVVLAPQCPKDYWWEPHALVVLLDEIIADYNIDRDRVYLTGLSMGGTGTWNLAAEYPDRFAAIAPVCGRSLPIRSKPIEHMPVWAFHGEKDHVVDVWNSKNQVKRLREAGNTRVDLTLYPDKRHNIWGPIYDGEALYDWFLRHERE